jgi:hypothetical protein
MGKISPPAIVWCVVAWTLTCGVTAGARAWEPTAAAVQEAVKGGDFAGFLAAAADWLAARTPDAVDEPALSRLLDDPLFADGEVRYHGQSLFAVAADTREAARHAVRLAKVTYEDLPALLDITAAKLSADGKTVTLAITALKPVNQQLLKFQLKTAGGVEFKQDVLHTINVIP